MKTFDYNQVKNPEYFRDNRLDAHSSHRYYQSLEAMEIEEEDFKYSLNGLWKFHYAKNYRSAIQGFEKEEYCCKAWDDIRVPAHIQMEGYDVRSMPMCSIRGKEKNILCRDKFRKNLILWQAM